MKKIITDAIFAVSIFFLSLSVTAYAAGSGLSENERSWIDEFNQVCSETGASMTLSEDQLKDRISSAEGLKGRLGTLDDSAKKVYSRRLDMCRNMYTFALEAKGKKTNK
ncbi:MAG: hypothetical protein M0Z61_03775 [Nitrospiraceae bacterium]|nr:hypothetical protein [Nitrospiraceae bacterium]